MTRDTLDEIARLNRLDVELYAFAKAVMFERFEALKAADEDFNLRFGTLGTTRKVNEEDGLETFVENGKKMFSLQDIEGEDEEENETESGKDASER